MKKRALSVLLAIALLVGMLPVSILSAGAYSDTDIPYAVEGGYIYFDKETGTITVCDESVTAANIPGEIDGVAVTSIGVDAFYSCENLTSVTIPNSVTSIGGSAFRNCDSLTSITIPDSVTSIDEYAFAYCDSLTSITIPDSVIYIGNEAFAYCDSLTGIWVDEANENYSSDENGVLFNKDKTTLIQCPGGYSGSYTIPDSVTSIAHGAFNNCDSLMSVMISDSVTSIGDSAFAYCDSLESVTIGDSVTSIGSYAFSCCSSLTSITIPDSVTSIGNFAFYRCDSLTSVTISDSVTSIGERAFYLCASLTGIWVDEANENYSSDENGVLFNKDKTDLIQCPGGYSGSYTIPDSVTSIAHGAFNNCDSLMSVMISDSVTSIGDSAFAYCDSLESVTIGNSVTSIGTFAFEACESLTSVTIGNSVTSIGPLAFYNCASLTSVTIPDSVTSIGSSAFEACESLTSATIGNSVTSIGMSAFSNCENLTSVTIPDSVTSIGWSAFSSCCSLESVTIPDSVTSIGSYAFAYCDSLTGIWVDEANENYSCDENGVLFDKDKTTLIQCPGSYSGSYTIPDSVTSIGVSAFADCHSLMSVTIPDSVTSIGTFAFESCESLTSVTIPNSVTSIESATFRYCSSLTSMTIPDCVTNIGSSAFEDCDSLTSVTIPNSVTSIESSAFKNCDSLQSVMIGNSVTSIEIAAFNNCDSLTSITIPDSVTSIGIYAFRDCDSLTGIWVDEANENYSSDENGVLFNKDKTTLIQCPGGYKGSHTIPDSVTRIENYAFAYCDSLESVTIPHSVTSIGDSAFLLCGSLTGIWVEEANENYSSDENGVLFNKDKTTLIQCPGGYSGSYTIPDSVTSIGWSAFEGCDSLKSVMIGNSVTSIGIYAFNYCHSLTGIWVEEENENYSSDENGVLFNKDKTTLIQCPGGYSGSYTIPDSVTSIDSFAFADCHSLTSVTIPHSVTSIDGYAFCDCNNLTGIFFLGDAPTIGEDVFDIWVEDSYQPIPGLTLYYTQGAEGWTTPTWNDYPTTIWDPNAPEEPIVFDDVSADAWYADAVEYAVENGLFNGMSETTFEPETAMTRAMLVTVLWRYAGEPMEGENTFTDVPDGQWYTDAVAWAAYNNIVGGVGDNKFDPNGNITREQMATILYRYASGQDIDTSTRADLSGFPDAGNVSGYAEDPICWAVAEGLINGSDGKLLPQGNATRAQVATILMRFIENIVG